jgi:gas vesicle protein
MNASGKIVLGFLLGTAIGTLTGLLLAPATGLRTRKNLNKKAKKIVKQLESMVGVSKVKRKTTTAHRKNGRASVATAR